MTSITTFAAVVLVFGDTAFNADACILAATTRPLAITALFALATSLTSWLGREVIFIFAKRTLEMLKTEVTRMVMWTVNMAVRMKTLDRRERAWSDDFAGIGFDLPFTVLGNFGAGRTSASLFERPGAVASI